MELKVWQLLLAFVIGGAIVGGCVYAYTSGMISQAYMQGYSAGYSQGQATVTTVEAADLEISATPESIDLSGYIYSNGSATETTQTVAVTIENDEDTPVTIQVTLVDPDSGEEGLPNALEKEEFSVAIGGVVTKYLFTDDEYKTGYTFTLDANSKVTFNVVVELEDAAEGTFADDQEYEMTLYIVQTESGDVDELELTVET